jgi:hypothetical protein
MIPAFNRSPPPEWLEELPGVLALSLFFDEYRIAKRRIRFMKVTEVKTYVVENPPPHYGGLYWVFMKLRTDNRINGFGEAYSVPFHPVGPYSAFDPRQLSLEALEHAANL